MASDSTQFLGFLFHHRSSITTTLHFIPSPGFVPENLDSPMVVSAVAFLLLLMIALVPMCSAVLSGSTLSAQAV